ncbi:MAG: hypothetical protein ABGZ53_33145 [Fuerstiella sp.]
MRSKSKSDELEYISGKHIMKYAMLSAILFATTVAGGALVSDADVTNDCGESLYLIESRDCEGKEVSQYVWASCVVKVKVAPVKGSCERSCRCECCEKRPRKI